MVIQIPMQRKILVSGDGVTFAKLLKKGE